MSVRDVLVNSIKLKLFFVGKLDLEQHTHAKFFDVISMINDTVFLFIFLEPKGGVSMEGDADVLGGGHC